VPFYTGVGQPVNALIGGADPVTTSAAGRLRIEPDQLDGAIAVFRDAWRALESEIRWATETITAEGPGRDRVSKDAADAFNRVAVGNKGSAVKVWRDAGAQLRSIVEALENAKLRNTQTDAGNARPFQVD